MRADLLQSQSVSECGMVALPSGLLSLHSTVLIQYSKQSFNIAVQHAAIPLSITNSFLVTDNAMECLLMTCCRLQTSYCAYPHLQPTLPQLLFANGELLRHQKHYKAAWIP
jgi:hypothetical protein